MNIWVPKLKILEPNTELVSRIGVSGRYIMEAIRPDGTKRKLAEFDNIVTNAGLDAIGTLTTWMNACQVGTGTNAAAAGDTGLQTYLAGTTNQESDTQSAQSSAPYYTQRTRTFRFNAGTATGNLTEVGIATANSGGTMFSRARIVDGSAVPTTITVLADEALDVTYIFRQYSSPTDITGSFTVTGVGSINYTIRAAAANSTSYNSVPSSAASLTGQSVAYDGNIGAITSTPAGISSPHTSSTFASYSAASYQRDVTALFGLTQANFPGAGGIKSVLVPLTLGGFQCEFTTRINKTSSQTLSLVFRNSWARKASP
jgi:hypothetical protein